MKYRKQPYRRPSRYNPYSVGNFVRTLAPAAIAYGTNYFTNTRSRNNVKSGQGVTNQYDRKVVYRKKYMPRRKKRAWKKFTRKVIAVNTKLLGSRTVLYNNTLATFNATNAQSFLACTLYGMDGGIGSPIAQGQDDIKRIFANDVNSGSQTDSFIFSSAIMDLTIVNDSVINEVSSAQQNTGVEVDVYEFKYSKVGDANWPGQYFAQAVLNTDLINTGQPAINLTNRGATPWDLPDALTIGGIKILKKTKYFLAQGQTATYQMRDPGNHIVSRSEVDNADNNFVNPKMTRTIFIVFKGVPTQDPTKVTSTLRIGCTRKYLYKIMAKEGKADNAIL